VAINYSHGIIHVTSHSRYCTSNIVCTSVKTAMIKLVSLARTNSRWQ